MHETDPLLPANSDLVSLPPRHSAHFATRRSRCFCEIHPTPPPTRGIPCSALRCRHLLWPLLTSPRTSRHLACYPLSVRQASALASASSRFAVTRDTLAVRLTLPLAGCVEDFHLQVNAPCRAHQKENPAFAGFRFTIYRLNNVSCYVPLGAQILLRPEVPGNFRCHPASIVVAVLHEHAVVTGGVAEVTTLEGKAHGRAVRPHCCSSRR